MEPGVNFGGLKVLMISSDRNILSPDSAVAGRMKEYGALVDELHIIVLSTNAHKLKDATLSKNVWVYPTNSISKWFYPGSAASLGKKIVKDRKFVRGLSLITTQDPFECGLAGLKIKRRWRLPLEVQLHTDPFSPHFTGSLNTVRKKLARKILPQADSIRVVSEYLKRRLADNYKLHAVSSKINVLPIFVDKLKIEEGKIAFDVHARFGWRFVMLSVARLTPEKNLPLAIQVLAKVRAKFPDTGLIILGEGPEESRLKALARKLGVEKGVVFEGWQTHLASYYKTSSMFLQTSNFEGYGMALVEAGLSGLPAVSTPVGIAAELDNEKDLYICPPGNAEYFAAAAMNLLEHNQKRENLKMNMKHTLGSKLLSKEDYLKELAKAWEETALMVKAS